MKTKAFESSAFGDDKEIAEFLFTEATRSRWGQRHGPVRVLANANANKVLILRPEKMLLIVEVKK